MKFLSALFILAVQLHADAAQSNLPIVTAARGQIGHTISYDPAYRSLEYPGGDVPIESGVCTDVVIRALRKSLQIDLQKLIHEDMKAHFQKYPKIWGLKSTDRNIDHRRVPNMRTYFSRSDWEIEVPSDFKDYQPGDLVTCIVPPNLPHIMIVSDKSGTDGRPLVIHNIGSGAREEDRLADFKITGLYRPRR
jgi:uncharacterized protein YijF (DUF1287 family)